MLGYEAWLKEIAVSLGIHEAVEFTRAVSQADLLTYYRHSAVYISMSEHEGFGKPLIESMYLGVPVLAYAATAVPGTMGEAGVLFHAKHYEAVAEMVDVLVKDTALRQRLIARQRERAQAFLEPHTRQIWTLALQALGAL